METHCVNCDALKVERDEQTESLRMARGYLYDLRHQLVAGEAARAALQKQVVELTWVLEKAEELVAYNHGKTAAQSFPEAWGELPKELVYHDERAALREAAEKVCEGFDKGFFVRDISRDHESSWAIHLFPYLAALGVLAKLAASAPERTT